MARNEQDVEIKVKTVVSINLPHKVKGSPALYDLRNRLDEIIQLTEHGDAEITFSIG